MNLADEGTWTDLLDWVIGIGCVFGFFAFTGITALFLKAHMSAGNVDEGIHALLSIFWPISLPMGIAGYYPRITFSVMMLLVSSTYYILRHVRRKHLATMEMEKTLKDDGVLG